MKNVYVITLDYKGHDDTKECLESLLKIKKNGFALSTLVIDNCPEDPIKLEESRFKQINLKVIYNKENLGFSGGNNVGIDFAMKNGADYIVILNNDTFVDPDFVTELLKQADEKGPGIFAPKIYFAKGYEFHKARYQAKDLGKVIWYAGGLIDFANVLGSHKGVDEVDKGQFDKDSETAFATGCCFLVSREVLEKVGYFDENFFLYYEDIDLSLRAKQNGYKIYFCPKSVVWHKNAGSSGGSGSVLQDYYITRNRLLFGMRYVPIRARVALIKESLKLILKGRKWQRKGVVDYYLGNLGKGSFRV